MLELSKINEFSGLVSQAAKLGKKSITLSYEQSVAMMHEINGLLIQATKNSASTPTTVKTTKFDGGSFKN